MIGSEREISGCEEECSTADVMRVDSGYSMRATVDVKAGATFDVRDRRFGNME